MVQISADQSNLVIIGRVYSVNTKGRSTPVILQAETSLAAGVSIKIDRQNVSFPGQLIIVQQNFSP